MSSVNITISGLDLNITDEGWICALSFESNCKKSNTLELTLVNLRIFLPLKEFVKSIFDQTKISKTDISTILGATNSDFGRYQTIRIQSCFHVKSKWQKNS